MQKCRLKILSINNAQEQSRQVLIDYANMLYAVDVIKTLKNMKKDYLNSSSLNFK